MDNANERLAKMEGKWDGIERRVDNQERRVSKLEENNEILHKMEVLLEMQTENNKEHTRQLDSFEKTLVKVNENLSNLNRSQMEMKDDISNINNRIEEVEKTQEKNEDRGKIDVIGLGKEIFKYVIMAVVAYILLSVGIG